MTPKTVGIVDGYRRWSFVISKLWGSDESDSRQGLDETLDLSLELRSLPLMTLRR